MEIFVLIYQVHHCLRRFLCLEIEAKLIKCCKHSYVHWSPMVCACMLMFTGVLPCMHAYIHWSPTLHACLRSLESYGACIHAYVHWSRMVHAYMLVFTGVVWHAYVRWSPIPLLLPSQNQHRHLQVALAWFQDQVRIVYLCQP